MESGPERVTPIEIGVRWAPNTSDPLFVQHRMQAILVIPAHFDDADQRRVVLRVDGCHGVWLGEPNDEGRSAHRLWEKGLADCSWAGEVIASSWIADTANRVQAAWHWSHPFDPSLYEDLHHWILLFKESTAECVGNALTVLRVDRSAISPALLRP